MDTKVFLIIIKQDHRGREVWRWRGRLLWATPVGWAVEATFSGPPIVVGGLSFRPGDRMIEFYYRHRWYNLFAVYDGPHGRIKGWYANIAAPAQRRGNRLIYRDWALDLVVLRDGQATVLDQEAFAALPLSPQERLQARRAFVEIRERFRRRGCIRGRVMLQ